MWLYVRGILFVIEQPSSSLLFAFAPIKRALALTGAFTKSVRLGSFGALTKKPLKLWGTSPILHRLRFWSNFLWDPDAVISGGLADVDEQGRVTGNQEALTESSSYPEPFSQTVEEEHALWYDRHIEFSDDARVSLIQHLLGKDYIIMTSVKSFLSPTY